MFTEKCTISKYLAYAMLIYTIGSIYYIVMTRNIGTPFNDSLNEEQIIIKKKSANVRRNIFYNGIGLATVFIYLYQPFKSC
jgi:hypothetical protein